MLALIDNAEDFIHRLYVDMYIKLVQVASITLRDYHTAEDLAQDVFTLALERREFLLNHPNPEGWLFNALTNKLLHEFRSRTRFKAVQLKLELQPSTKRMGRIGFKSNIFDRLTEKEYKLLKMIYIEGFTIREVSNELGLPYERCRRHVKRAKEKLRIVNIDD